MVIRVERLGDESYRRKLPGHIKTSLNIHIKRIDSNIRRSQRELDSTWDSFKNIGLHEDVIKTIYNGRKEIIAKYIKEKEQYEQIENGNVVCFSLDCEKMDIDWDYVLYCIEKLLKDGKKVCFCVDGDIATKNNDSKINYTYTKEELQLLGEIDSLLKRYNQDGIYFNERSKCKSYYTFEKLYTYEEVKIANEKIEEIVNDIISFDLTPFEIMLYVHEYITNNFVGNDEKKNIQDSRSLPGIFKYGCIACSGYASIEKAIIDRLNNPQLRCMIVGCTYRDVKSDVELMYQYVNHTHNLICIDDMKYDLNGVYVDDCTKDRRCIGQNRAHGISCCLHPIEDIFHYSDFEYYHIFYSSREKNVLETVVHPLFRNPKRYKNKERIAQLYKKYKDKSTPINIETYIRGLKVISPLLGIDMDREIDESKRVASIIFDEYATNCFSKSRVISK